MGKIETGDLDLSGINLLSGDTEGETTGQSLFQNPEEDSTSEGQADKADKADGKTIVDARTEEGKKGSMKIENIPSLEEELNKKETEEEEEEEEEEEDDSSLKDDKKKTSKKESKDESEEDESEEEEEEEDSEDSEEDEPSPFTNFAKFLDENGIADFDEEDFEDSEEGLLKMVDKTVKKGVDAYKDSIPESAKKFLDYLEAGGDPKNYIEESKNLPNYEGLNEDMLGKESVQKALVADWMKMQGYEDDEIQETLKDYEESGLLEKQSKRVHSKLVKKQKEYEESLIENQKKEKEEAIRKHEEYVENVRKTIEEAEDIAGIPISKKAKKEFSDYVTKVDKEGKTKLHQDIEADPDAQLKMAWFMYNKFDFSKIEKKAKTKVSSKLRESLSNIDSSLKMKGKSKGKAKRSSDNDELDLSGFKRLL